MISGYGEAAKHCARVDNKRDEKGAQPPLRYV